MWFPPFDLRGHPFAGFDNIPSKYHIWRQTIRNYRCKDTERLANNYQVRRFLSVERYARCKLTQLDAAATLAFLRALGILPNFHGLMLFLDEAGHWVKFIVVRIEVISQCSLFSGSRRHFMGDAVTIGGWGDGGGQGFTDSSEASGIDERAET